MDFENKYNTYKEVDEMIAAVRDGNMEAYKTHEMDMHDLRKRHHFMIEHPGHCYAYSKRRKRIVIPKVSMRENMICNIRDLSIGNHSPSESIIVNRENYAKQALIMFYPHRRLEVLMLGESFWSKFVQVGGLVPYNSTTDSESGKDKLCSLWEKGKDILHNIQAKLTMENEMKRPPDPIQLQTEKPTKTGERAKSNIDDDYYEVNYDVEISDFDVDLDEAEERFLEPVARDQLRDSNAVIERATISKDNIVNIEPESNNLLVTRSDKTDELKNDSSDISITQCDTPRQNYRTVISLIAGSLIGDYDDIGEDNTRENMIEEEQIRLPSIVDNASI